MTRAQFLRWLGVSGLGLFLPRSAPVVTATTVRSAGASPSTISLPPTTFIHYYPWWGGGPGYRHWNGGDPDRPDPVDNIAATFYPQLATYDSRDSSGTIDRHLSWISQAGVDTLIVSWWGQGSYEDAAAARVLAAAASHDLHVCFQIEPYQGRTAASTVADIAYLYAAYGASPAFYRATRPTLNGPSTLPRGIFFVYEPTGPGWSTALAGIRETPFDAIVLVRTDDSKMFGDSDVRSQIGWTGADGMYNYGYYAAPGTYAGSLPRSSDYLLIYATSPGFDNSRAPGGNEVATISRGLGAAYDLSWQPLVEKKPEGVAIVSFNEWHEGTQIEPAQPHSYAGLTYQDYDGHYNLSGTAAASAYVTRTAYWVGRYRQSALTPPPPISAALPHTVDIPFVSAGR